METLLLLSENRSINNDSVTQFVPWFFESFGRMSDVLVLCNTAILLAEAHVLSTANQRPHWEGAQRPHWDRYTYLCYR